MAIQVEVRALRAFHCRGEVVDAGATVRVSPTDAYIVLEGGRGVLVKKADIEHVRAAVQADTAVALKRASTPHQFAPPAPPWRPA